MVIAILTPAIAHQARRRLTRIVRAPAFMRRAGTGATAGQFSGLAARLRSR
jgi:hypothetical protein